MADEEIAAYRRQIVRLTTERDEARRERDEARGQLRTETEQLRALIREGTSAQVEALRRMLAAANGRSDRQARLLQTMRRAS